MVLMLAVPKWTWAGTMEPDAAIVADAGPVTNPIAPGLGLENPFTRPVEFRLAAFNVETYLDVPTESRKDVKTDMAKAKVRESILSMAPDVLVLEEMGTPHALKELQAGLASGGLKLPYWDWVEGYDTNIHVSLLSRFPIVARHPHTKEFFLLDGRRFQVSRGFLDDDIAVAPDFRLTVIGVHLKSRRPVTEADEADLRYEEAKLLRRVVDDHLRADPLAKLVVAGDMNDVPDSASTKVVVGRGKNRLWDTRPAEKLDDGSGPHDGHRPPRTVAWTHFYGVDDTYSRIDYILLSPAMKRHWLPGDTYIPRVEGWGLASDHRPVLASFQFDP